MTFRFSRQGLSAGEARLERWFELLPGLCSWTILAGMLVLSFREPLLAAVLIIAFDLYWLFRLFYLTLFLVLSSVRLSIERDTDWMARVRSLDAPADALAAPAGGTPGHRLSCWLYRRQLAGIVRDRLAVPPSNRIHHLVLYTVATESPETLADGLESLTRQTFPAQRILLVLAVEQRAGAAVIEGLRALQRRYTGRFLDCLLVLHPRHVQLQLGAGVLPSQLLEPLMVPFGEREGRLRLGQGAAGLGLLALRRLRVDLDEHVSRLHEVSLVHGHGDHGGHRQIEGPALSGAHGGGHHRHSRHHLLGRILGWQCL